MNEKVYSFWTNIIAAIILGTLFFMGSEDNGWRWAYEIVKCWLIFITFDVFIWKRRRFTWKWNVENKEVKNGDHSR